MSKTGVFLDRDDTLIKDVPYLDDPAKLKLLPGAAALISTLNKKGIPAILITNQSGIARGLFSEKKLSEIHERLESLLAEKGAKLDAIYYCPHHPEGIIEKYAFKCKCRKPETGMLLEAASKFGLELERCYFIGDKPDDMEVIHKVKGKAVLLKLQVKSILLFRGLSTPDYIAEDILDAESWILADIKNCNYQD